MLELIEYNVDCCIRIVQLCIIVFDSLDSLSLSLACTKPEIMVPTNKNLSSLSFTLEWSTIDTGLLHNYTLSYYSIGQLPVVKRLTEREEITIPADSTSYTVENLTPFSSYCFTLEALYVQQDIVFDRQRSELCDINTPPLSKFCT